MEYIGDKKKTCAIMLELMIPCITRTDSTSRKISWFLNATPCHEQFEVKFVKKTGNFKIQMKKSLERAHLWTNRRISDGALRDEKEGCSLHSRLLMGKELICKPRRKLSIQYPIASTWTRRVNYHNQPIPCTFAFKQNISKLWILKANV